MVEVKLVITEEEHEWLWNYMVMAEAEGSAVASTILSQLSLPNVRKILARELEIAEKVKGMVDDGEDESS